MAELQVGWKEEEGEPEKGEVEAESSNLPSLIQDSQRKKGMKESSMFATGDVNSGVGISSLGMREGGGGGGNDGPKRFKY